MEFIMTRFHMCHIKIGARNSFILWVSHLICLIGDENMFTQTYFIFPSVQCGTWPQKVITNGVKNHG